LLRWSRYTSRSCDKEIISGVKLVFIVIGFAVFLSVQIGSLGGITIAGVELWGDFCNRTSNVVLSYGTWILVAYVISQSLFLVHVSTIFVFAFLGKFPQYLSLRTY